MQEHKRLNITIISARGFDAPWLVFNAVALQLHSSSMPHPHRYRSSRNCALCKMSWPTLKQVKMPRLTRSTTHRIIAIMAREETFCISRPKFARDKQCRADTCFYWSTNKHYFEGKKKICILQSVAICALVKCFLIFY